MDGERISAEEALKRLRRGNRRFIEGRSEVVTDDRRRLELSAGQRPFAVVLGCADSRVPVEHIFDQGLGDLFVIRVAGNLVTPTITGSVEYAVANCGSRLVVVLGHTQCGAIAAAVNEIVTGERLESDNLRALTTRIHPVVETLRDSGQFVDSDALRQEAVRANVWASVNQLQSDSEFIAQEVQNGSIKIVGAEYSLKNGTVTFFHGV